MCPKKQSSQWLEKHDNLSYSSFDLESLRKSGLGHLIYEDKIWSPALLIENGKDIVGLKKGNFSPIIKRKKENDMSLILMMKNQNGLVAVSDSKSTISNGMEEKYGRNVQKIFKGNNYILGTWGVNMLHIDVTVRIEDVLKSLVERYPDDFGAVLKEFQYHLKRDCEEEYYFIVGFRLNSQYYKDNYSYIIEGYTITAGDINMNFSDCSPSGCRAAGVIDMLPRNFSINMNWTEGELKKKAELLMQTAIKLGNEFMPYNPVGGEIQMLYLK